MEKIERLELREFKSKHWEWRHRAGKINSTWKGYSFFRSFADERIFLYRLFVNQFFRERARLTRRRL